MKNIILTSSLALLITACGTPETEQSSLFYDIKPVGTSTYQFVDFATKLDGLSAVIVKAKGKTYSDVYTYNVDCDGDNNILGIKYADDKNWTTQIVQGSSMYNIAKATCWMNYLAVNDINYTEYLHESN